MYHLLKDQEDYQYKPTKGNRQKIFIPIFALLFGVLALMAFYKDPTDVSLINLQQGKQSVDFYIKCQLTGLYLYEEYQPGSQQGILKGGSLVQAQKFRLETSADVGYFYIVNTANNRAISPYTSTGASVIQNFEPAITTYSRVRRQQFQYIQKTLNFQHRDGKYLVFDYQNIYYPQYGQLYFKEAESVATNPYFQFDLVDNQGKRIQNLGVGNTNQAQYQWTNPPRCVSSGVQTETTTTTKLGVKISTNAGVSINYDSSFKADLLELFSASATLSFKASFDFAYEQENFKETVSKVTIPAGTNFCEYQLILTGQVNLKQFTIYTDVFYTKTGSFNEIMTPPELPGFANNMQIDMNNKIETAIEKEKNKRRSPGSNTNANLKRRIEANPNAPIISSSSSNNQQQPQQQQEWGITGYDAWNQPIYGWIQKQNSQQTQTQQQQVWGITGYDAWNQPIYGWTYQQTNTQQQQKQPRWDITSYNAWGQPVYGWVY